VLKNESVTEKKLGNVGTGRSKKTQKRELFGKTAVHNQSVIWNFKYHTFWAIFWHFIISFTIFSNRYVFLG
jgi:hypothetical protein